MRAMAADQTSGQCPTCDAWSCSCAKEPTASDLARMYWSRNRFPGVIVSVRERKDGSVTVRWRDPEDGDVGDFHISKDALHHPTDTDYMAHEMRQRAYFERDNSAQK